MIFFVSGHRNIKWQDFEKHYIPKIEEAIMNNKDNIGFVVGDYYGVDIIFQSWMAEAHPELIKKIKVYHMFDNPRNVHSLIPKENYVGGFQNDVERDSAMTNASDADIAFIEKGRWTSGTAQNILRRFEF